MMDYLKRFTIALLMALCVTLLIIGGGMAQSKNESKKERETTNVPGKTQDGT
ncbi:hypothetical protein [Bacillus xiapuensis]|uniref:hypothetical protein n=1 Tax=Bacillus xiapuensis TaxID=2014075 RepID=UPI0012FDBFF9|nr:hypothetical protein [Bacillus xiapuensis]